MLGCVILCIHMCMLQISELPYDWVGWFRRSGAGNVMRKLLDELTIKIRWYYYRETEQEKLYSVREKKLKKT
ncbi:uncharacterized protein ASCRUDRAFT_154624 [Ascoidea rubescens DSM 1968]|uniref:Uncharacterized protein n=1 Tax=Ascoidea rubescens DSM 1968 TaxID=1344418 RepID=A0A1D2VG71_9ASCO|nr:hypothetical protein ASCRUDRAFT_154624 [Ascoidea rubescens DSM 1968]ODV60503.1 hypothetical protein ASCRUDRAFT_154624 [Ascoidea rubescens DSM 1968]